MILLEIPVNQFFFNFWYKLGPIADLFAPESSNPVYCCPFIVMVQKECGDTHSERLLTPEKTKEIQILEIQKSIEILTKSLEQIRNEPDVITEDVPNPQRQHSNISNIPLQLNATNPFSIEAVRRQGAIPKGRQPPPWIVTPLQFEIESDDQHGESLYNEDPIPAINTQSSPKASCPPRINFNRFPRDDCKEKGTQNVRVPGQVIGSRRIIDEHLKMQHNRITEPVNRRYDDNRRQLMQ